MSKANPILPLSSADVTHLDDPLLDPEHFDDENHEPTRMILDLLEALRRGIFPCSETVTWFDAALTRFATGEAKDFGVALGLPPAVRKQLQYKLQSNHLRDALESVDHDVVGTKARAEILADEVQRFEMRYGAAMPPAPLPEWYRLRRCIWRARMFGSLPKSWKRIANRCER